VKTLYVSQPDCYIALQQENIIVKKGDVILAKMQIPLLEQILVFGKSQISTQAIRTCLWRNIPIAYLSRMGYCYGRILPIERGYRQLARYQQQLEFHHRLLVAKQIVIAKLKNSRLILQRIQRKRLDSETVAFTIKSLECLSEKASRSGTIERLMG
jgi:CRISP-associated protein Cas1